MLGFLYPVFFLIVIPLGFIVGFALVAIIWELACPTSEFEDLRKQLLPFALLSIVWGLWRTLDVHEEVRSRQGIRDLSR